MENACKKYVLQVNKARETINILESELSEISRKLKATPTDANYLKELKRVTLDMTITLNELEHSQSLLEECHAQSVKAEEKYND